jgi:flagellar biogenesis protein FliO
MIFRVLICLILINTCAYAATADYTISDSGFLFTMQFDRGYSNVDTLTSGQDVIVSFETTEEIAFPREDFFDAPMQSAWLTADGTRKKIFFRFDGAIIEPTINKQARSVTISFATPIAAEQAPQSPSIPTTSPYKSMFTGLFIIIAIILLSFGLMKYFFKHTITTDIPGIGRLLGRVDVELKKSLVFYELGETIYMIGICDGSITLIDKLTDPVDVNLVKAGFSRRKDFSSYMKFFRKKNEIADDLKDSSTLIEEKLSTLRKK